MASKEAEALIQKYGGGWAADRANAEQIRQAAKEVGTWGVQQNSTLAFTPPKAVVPEEKKTAVDKLWDRGNQPQMSQSTQAKRKADAAKKKLDNYLISEEKKASDAERNEKAKRLQIQQSVMDAVSGNPGSTIIKPEADPMETRLRDEYNRAQAEADAAETDEIMQTDLNTIATLSDEDRRALEQYAVNQIGDQNRTLEMVGVLPTAQQQAAGLIAKYGQKRVDELAETYMRQQNAMLAQQVEKKARQQANQHGILSSLATIPVAAASGVVSTVGQLQGAARNTGRYKTLDPNATGTIGDIYTGAVRGQVAQNIEGEDPTLLRKGLSIGYQGLMSAADSIARAYLGGGAFGGAALAATGSFSQTMADASRQGATPAQAALLATANAGIEALSEKIPLEDMINIARGGAAPKAIWNILGQMGIEATTEEVSLLGTLLAEAAILQEKSGYRQTISDLMADGKSFEEARQIAARQIFDEAVNTALVSAVAGIGGGITASYAKEAQLFEPSEKKSSAQTVEDVVQQAVENRQERIAVEQAPQEAVQPQTQAQQVQEAQTVPQTQPQRTPVQNQQDNNSDYYDEFENWGADPNREGVNDPLAGRNYSEVGKRNVKAYMYENPKVKPFYQEQAAWLLSELSDSTKGERTYNEQLHYDSGGEQGWSGVSRNTSESIAELLDQDGMSYSEIERGLNAIINDNGQENNAVSKRIEFIINDRLMNGYTDFYTGQRVPGNADYLNLLRNQQSASQTDTEYQSTEGGQIKGTGAAEQNFSEKPAYNATLSEDNAQADRQNDVRPMEIPARDISDNPVSATTGNVYASQNTPDDLAAAMEEPVARGDYSYVRISNDAATERARQEIGRVGDWNTARLDFARDVESGIAGAEISARGALILNHAAEVYQQAKDSGDMQAAAKAKKEWLGILSDVQKLGTNTAQGLQALKIIRNLAPQDKIQFAQIAVQNMVRDMRLNTDIQIDEQLLAEYESATTDQQRDEVMEKIQQNVADQIPSTMLDKWNALRYTNMLGNLKTNVRNVAGNAANTAVYRFKDLTGAVLESIVNKASGGKVGRTKSVVVNKQLRKAMEPYYQQVKSAIGSGGKYADNAFASSDFSQGVMDKRRIFKSNAKNDTVRKIGDAVLAPMEGYRKATNWMMNNKYFGDEAFGKAAFTRSLAGYLQANGIRNAADVKNASPDLMDRAIAYAVKEAQETTFHDNSALANVLGKLKKDAGVVGEGIFPFTKTPANVLTRAEEYSPLGILNTAILSAQKAAGNTRLAEANGQIGRWAARGQDISGTDIINSLSKSLTGAGIFALGAILQNHGIINGGPDDDEEQAEFDLMNGQQPYSINLPDGTTYTLDWLTPVAMPLFMGAQLMKIAGEKDLTFADLEQIFTSIADPMLQMSMLQGLNDSLENIKYSENNMGQFFMNAAVNYLTQGLTNTLLGQIERSTEEYRMTTYVDKDSSVPQWMQRALGKASQKIPGWDYQQTEYIDRWGEKQKNNGGIFENFLSPGYASEKKTDDVTNELNRLRKSTGENIFPDAASQTITYTDKDGNTHKDQRLTEEQYQTLATTQGQTAKNLISDMIKSKDYAALSDEQKAKAIEYVYQYARETGEQAAFEDHLGYSQAWLMDLNKSNNKVGDILNKVGTAMLSGAMGKLDSAWDNNYSAANQKALGEQLKDEFEAYAKMSQSAKKKIRDEATGTTKKYIESREKGVSHDDFLKVAKGINNVKGTGKYDPDTKKNAVRDIDKRTVIADMPGVSDAARDTLMRAYMTDYDPTDESPTKTEPKYDFIRQEMGLTSSEYVDSYRVFLDVDGKNNEIRGIMDAIGCDYSTARKLRYLYGGWYKGNDWENYLAGYKSK